MSGESQKALDRRSLDSNSNFPWQENLRLDCGEMSSPMAAMGDSLFRLGQPTAGRGMHLESSVEKKLGSPSLPDGLLDRMHKLVDDLPE